MTLQGTIRGALLSIIAAHPELAVTVVYKGASATGLKALQSKDTNQELDGTAGAMGFDIRVSTAAIQEPVQGKPITIDGNQVFVNQVRQSGGLYVIECVTSRIAAEYI